MDYKARMAQDKLQIRFQKLKALGFGYLFGFRSEE